MRGELSVSQSIMAERLSPGFVQELLRASEPGLSVTEVQVRPGAGRGDNYTAMLYRIHVTGVITSTGSAWERPLIYKCLPASAERRQAYRSDALFSNEVAFYTRALPALLAFQASRGVEEGFRAVPRCHTARHDLLLLEDLRDRDFAMMDRKAGLGELECRAVLTELAKFHALSLAMRALQPAEFALNVASCIREALFVPENERWYREYYAAACGSALSVVRELLAPHYSARMENFTTGFFARMTALVAPSQPLDQPTSEGQQDQEPIVLCHGDCWTNNILFRRDPQQPTNILEVCLLDFQLARVGSPALDLANLLYCCTSGELRRAHLQSLLRHYHAQVSRSLRMLDAPVDLLSWDTLTREMRRFAAFGLGLALDMIPISTCESAEAPDLYHGTGQESPVLQSSPPAETPRISLEAGEQSLTQSPLESLESPPEGCALLQAPPTRDGKLRMAELVKELVDENLI